MRGLPSKEKVAAAIEVARKQVAAFARNVAPMYAALGWRWHDDDRVPRVPDRKRIREMLYRQLDNLPGVVQQVRVAFKDKPGCPVSPCGVASGGLSTTVHEDDGEAVVVFEFTASRAEAKSSGGSALWW